MFDLQWSMLCVWKTYYWLCVKPQFFHVTLIKELICYSFGQLMLDLPRLGNGTHITGCHQHAAEHCKKLKLCRIWIILLKWFLQCIRAKEPFFPSLALYFLLSSLSSPSSWAQTSQWRQPLLYGGNYCYMKFCLQGPFPSDGDSTTVCSEKFNFRGCKTLPTFFRALRSCVMQIYIVSCMKKTWLVVVLNHGLTKTKLLWSEHLPTELAGPGNSFILFRIKYVSKI